MLVVSSVKLSLLDKIVVRMEQLVKSGEVRSEERKENDIFLKNFPYLEGLYKNVAENSHEKATEIFAFSDSPKSLLPNYTKKQGDRV